MPTFTQALTVAPGERTTADQMASLAAAANSRLPHGDCVWRILWYFHSLVRTPRNPNEGFTGTPPDGEWWFMWQHIRPEDYDWPQSPPGLPEGGNLSNILMGWHYGPPSPDIGSELSRLASVPVGFAGVEELRPADIWYLGQLQRGSYDPTTGDLASLSFSTARAYGYVRQSGLSPHGNSYGGFYPIPDTNYIFTSLPDGAETRTYAVADYEVVYTPDAYILFDASDVQTILPKAQWLEGPYDGETYLIKKQANLLARGLNAFASEFRGTPDQGAGTTNKHAFDTQEFFTTQYPLAPAFGVSMGGGVVNPIYPSWSKSGPSAAAGTSVGGTWAWPDGTVCTGFIFVGSKLRQSCAIEVIEAGDVLRTVTIPAGDSDVIWWLPEARRPGTIRVRLVDALETEDATEERPFVGIFVEATQLIEYKPGIPDWYLVTRLSGFNGLIDRIDGRGIDFESANRISTALYDNGCIIPLVDTGDGLSPAGFDPTFNQNATYDAMRRWIKSMARIIPRFNLTGYAVEGGKSVLWFNRTAYGPPGLPERDMWEGIGPALEHVTSIKWGREYKVSAGVVTYGREGSRASYTVGDTFTGIQGVTEFTGGGTVLETDGIRATAEPRDWSNRWLLTVLSLKPYSNSNSSLWKTDAFADVNSPFWARWHFYDPTIQFSDEATDHFSYGVPLVNPESPSGYTFVRLNDTVADNANEGASAEFYKSCRLYEPALEIESAVMDGAELKVTLNGRLHSHEDAPGSIDRDLSSWNTVDLAAEDYRTHENGIRDYLAWQGLGINSQWKVGDDGYNSSLQTDPDAPLGCCLPTFGLLKMVPEPYLDGNDTRQEHDSYRTHDQLKQAEVYLRAACEGFVDTTSSAERARKYFTTTVVSYSYENLMFQACGNRQVPFDLTVRPDNPFTFGPMPNTRFYSEQFNALANGWNLLTDLPIMLPAEFQMRSHAGSSTSAISAKGPCGDPLPCSSTADPWFAYAHGSASASPSVAGAWAPFVDGSGANAGYSLRSSATVGDRCSGDSWVVDADVTSLDIKWTLTDADAYNALPLDYASLLDTNSIAIMKSETSVLVTKLVNGHVPDPGAPVEFTGLCGGNYVWHESVEVQHDEYCGAIMGTVTAPTPPAGIMTSARSDTSGDPGTVAGSGGASSVSVEVFTDGVGLVRCPTVAYAGGS